MPCGRCMECRIRKRREWAIRCMHEASLHDRNAYITLTYNDEHLPAFGALVKSDFQKFMKRLRKSVDHEIRYFHAGEYGDDRRRPHYHALLFGHSFPDMVRYGTRNGHPIYGSVALGKLWPQGFHEIGEVTFESASYVASYVEKKVMGNDEVAEEMAKKAYARVDPSTGEVAQVQPEYATMSRRPGIGRGWLEKYGHEVALHDSVIVSGRELRPARYYDEVLKVTEAELMRVVKRKRKQAMEECENDPDRAAAREKILKARKALRGGNHGDHEHL